MASALFKLILGLALIVFVVIIGPVLIIWALNTLFPALNIPFSFETWAAAAVLGAPFTSTLRNK